MVRHTSPLRQARCDAGLTQSTVAEQLDMGVRTLRRCESRPESIPIKRFVHLAAICRVSPHDLLDECIRHLHLDNRSEQPNGHQPTRKAGWQAPRPAWSARHDDRVWVELRSLLLHSVPSRLPAQHTEGVVQDTLLRLSCKPDPCDERAPCRQGNGRECPAHCGLARLGRKILRGVVADRFRRLRKEPRSGQDLETPSVDPHDKLNLEADAWETFRSKLQDILWLIEPTMPAKQARVTRLIVGDPNMRSIEALAEAMGQEVKDTKGLLRRWWQRIQRLLPRANSRASRRLRK